METETKQKCSSCKNTLSIDKFKMIKGKVTKCCQSCLDKAKENRSIKLKENQCSRCLTIREEKDFGINEKTGEKYKLCKVCRKIDIVIPEMNDDERFCPICETVK